MIRTLAVFLLCASFAAIAIAQDKKDTQGSSKSLADRLGKVWQESNPDTKGSFSGIGAAVQESFTKIDRRRVGDLEGRISELESMKVELQQQLADLDMGLPIALESWPTPAEALGNPVDERTLKDEKSTLLALEAELARRRIAAKKNRIEEERRRQAQRISRRGTALLGVDTTLAKATTKKADAPVAVVGPHALELGEALYRTGDFRGAIRQFEAALKAPGAKITPRHHYLLARAKEETGDFAGAAKALDALDALVPDEKSFWRRRSLRTREIIEKSKSVRSLLNRRKS